MSVLLGIIAVFAYLFGGLVLLVAMAPPRGSDIELILAALAFTCGTVALAGIGVMNAVSKLIPRQPKKEAPELAA